MNPAWLFEGFEKYRDAAALVWRGQAYGYGWLADEAEALERGLATHGVGAGSVIALDGDYSPNACAFLLAAISAGAIVVPLTSAAAGNRGRFLDIAQVQTLARCPPGGTPSYEATGREVSNPLLLALRERSEPGLVLFTSGSTGEPKAALHSFTRLLEKYRTPRPSLRTLAFLLLDHIGGINTLFHIISNGGSVVTVEDRSPDAVCAAIERHRVELLPTTPTFLNLLLISEAHSRHDLSSLRQITYGTEPMPAATLERLHALLPGVRLSQTYGLSELGILRAKSRSSDSLWVRLGGEGVETKVVDGILKVRSSSAMLGYLNAPSPFDGDGWFDTQDEVVVDGDFFRILGRRSEIINVGGEKVYPAEVESVLLRLENVRDVMVRGEKSPILGQIVAAYFNLAEPESGDSLRNRVRAHCRGRLRPFQVPGRIEVVDREQYSERFKKIRALEPGEPVEP
ncbi:MAG TPA: AMP-binding protein [Thermoanaerobaculia bacterium]|nr:AMP-binding protein [Thermoanaerobaculia bacterium]